MKPASPEKIRRCKFIAFAGVAVMGVGSFMACLPDSQTLLLAGTAILIAGIIISSYGFIYWRP